MQVEREAVAALSGVEVKRDCSDEVDALRSALAASETRMSAWKMKVRSLLDVERDKILVLEKRCASAERDLHALKDLGDVIGENRLLRGELDEARRALDMHEVFREAVLSRMKNAPSK